MDRTPLFTREHHAFRKAFDNSSSVRSRRTKRNGASKDRSTARCGARPARKAGNARGSKRNTAAPAPGPICSMIVMQEELANAYESGFAMALHSDIIVPYIFSFGTDQQKRTWLPGCASGELVTAVAMTEPGTGSDLAALATTAMRSGDDYVINGAKTFISNGQLCDLIVVAAKTVRIHERAHKGISLFDRRGQSQGFARGERLHKMGMASQDTSEMFFEDCRVPGGESIGCRGAGFMMLMQKLQQERLCRDRCGGGPSRCSPIRSHIPGRKAFGKPISSSRTRSSSWSSVSRRSRSAARTSTRSSPSTSPASSWSKCSIAKFWATDMAQEVIDTCLQFFGGYGYMLEYPVTRAFMDARVQRIYAGTNEIMKVIVAKQLGL